MCWRLGIPILRHCAPPCYMIEMIGVFAVSLRADGNRLCTVLLTLLQTSAVQVRRSFVFDGYHASRRLPLAALAQIGSTPVQSPKEPMAQLGLRGLTWNLLSDGLPCDLFPTSLTLLPKSR